MKQLVTSLFYLSVFISLYSVVDWPCILPVVFIFVGKCCYEWLDIQKFSDVENRADNVCSFDDHWAINDETGLNYSIFDDENDQWNSFSDNDDYWWYYHHSRFDDDKMDFISLVFNTICVRDKY